MKITLKLKEDKYYEDMMTVMQNIPPFDQLTNTEIKVYARLLHYYQKFAFLGEEEANIRVFNYVTKRNVQEDLNVNDSVFRNCLTALRKVGVLDKKNIVKKYVPKYGSPLIIEFKEQGVTK